MNALNRIADAMERIFSTRWDQFLDNILIPLLAFLALCVFLCNQSRAGDFEINLVPEAEHMSHAGQHRPFTDTPTKYGANLLGVGLDFSYKAFSVALVESWNISPSYMVYGTEKECGEIMGGRENFSLRIQYKFLLLSRH